MIVGVPTEIKPDERRVALTPAGVAAFRSHGHSVLVQRGAGAGSGFDDRDYRAAGAQDHALGRSGMGTRARWCSRSRSRIASEFRFLRPDLILFTYLHLAAEPRAGARTDAPPRRPRWATKPCSSRTAACRCSRR